MIFFFGTRPGKQTFTLLENTECPFCKQTGTLSVSKSSNWFHFFWIKLFKISSNLLADCSHCKRAYYENEFTEEMKKGAANL